MSTNTICMTSVIERSTSVSARPSTNGWYITARLCLCTIGRCANSAGICCEQQREEQHAPTREERHCRVVQPEEHRADGDRLQDERRELDDLRGDPAADDLEAAEHERARLHRDRDDVNVATVTMYGLLERVWFARWSLKLDL